MTDPDIAPPSVGYAICGVARSGSSWFCKALASTGKLGRPEDTFSTPYQRRLFGPDYPADRARQIRRVLTLGATRNGVYGVKVFPPQLARLGLEVSWTHDLPGLRFIHWRRRDLLGQALSLYRAFETLQWRSTLEALGEVDYDGAAILETLKRVARQDARWEVYFARNDLVPLRLDYEDAMEDLQAAIDAVAALVGVEGAVAADPARIELAIQRDDTTAAWRDRFLNEFGDPDDAATLRPKAASTAPR